MTVTVNLPPDIERAFLAEAQAKGISLNDRVGGVLMARAASAPSSFAPRRSRLWELRRDLTLGDVSIRELIAEGRECACLFWTPPIRSRGVSGIAPLRIPTLL